MQRKLLLLALLGGGLLAALLWLGRLCAREDQLTYLPQRAPAQWLVYPKPTVPHLQAVAELPTSFRRSFRLAQVPGSAQLSVCACRHAVVVLNGRRLPMEVGPAHWKEPSTLEVTPYLRAGENVLSVTVFNSLGPPALWLSLRGDGLGLASDTTWEASYAGAVWRPVQLAAQPAPRSRGNLFWANQSSVQALKERWRWWGGVVVLAGLLMGGARWWLGRAGHRTLPRRWQWTADPATALLGLMMLLWVLLFAHNLSWVPGGAGFDAEGHLKYIHYIQEHGALPWADAGWEMHQPPLYYVLGAAVLSALRLSALSADGVLVLRLMGLAIGLAHLGLVWLSLRLLFPGSPGKQAAGLTLAGFLPMQIYLTHYVTNETLAACLMSATLYSVLRLVLAPRSTWRLFLAVGISLGLALLTKVTALVLVPFVLVALIYRALAGDTAPVIELSTVKGAQGRGWGSSPGHLRWAGPVLALAACLAVCAWHYGRVWRHFGHAFFVPTRWSYAVGWWQDPGYHTAAYFGRFGQALTAPFFSGVSSFADGLYTTLWGDGLCGGAADLLVRPPWNYDLMAGGFLLALWPTLVILLGACAVAFGRGWEPAAGAKEVASAPEAGSPTAAAGGRRAAGLQGEGSRRWFVVWLGLLGFALALLLAIVHLNLEVPGYAEAKAIFGLAALIPLCAFAAAGWGALFEGRSRIGFAGSLLLCVWALGSYASFWVRADAPAARAALGRACMNRGDLSGAVAQFESALRTEPHHLAAGSFLVSALLEQGQLPAAAQVAQGAVAAHPQEAVCHLDLAAVLERQGQRELALEQTRRAVELAPDYSEARLKLASRLFALRRLPQSVAACREALRLTPADPEVHFLLASALNALSRQPGASLECAGGESLRCGPISALSAGEVLEAEAMNHFELVTRLAPNTTEALSLLAWALATEPRTELRDGREALRLAERACLLTEHRNGSALAALAAAYAETGRFGAAMTSAVEAEKAAATSGDQALVALARRMQAGFQTNQPFRQEPATR